jgi:hypothetical protein
MAMATISSRSENPFWLVVIEFIISYPDRFSWLQGRII